MKIRRNFLFFMLMVVSTTSIGAVSKTIEEVEKDFEKDVFTTF